MIAAAPGSRSDLNSTDPTAVEGSMGVKMNMFLHACADALRLHNPWYTL
jgi:hypothetical protein